MTYGLLQPTPSDGDRLQVFVSHATADRAVVEWVSAQLRALGVNPYLAEGDPQPGGQLAMKIREAIDRSDVFLVLLTTSGAASRYVHQEIGAAHQVGKPLLLLVEAGLETGSLAVLDGVEYLEFDPDELGASSATLITVVNRLSAQHGRPPPSHLKGETEPALQLQFSAQMQLTPGQVLLGLLVLTAIAGLVYVTANDDGVTGSSAGIA